MAPTIDEVTEAVESILGPGGQFDLEIEAGKVSGLVAHPKFFAMPVSDRRQMLWEGLRSHFGARASEIGILLLYSPEEWQAMAS